MGKVQFNGISLKAVLVGLFVRFATNVLLSFAVIISVAFAHVAISGRGAPPISVDVQHVMTLSTAVVASIFAGTITHKTAEEAPMKNIVLVGLICSAWSLWYLLRGISPIAGTPLWYGWVDMALIIPGLCAGGILRRRFTH